jgi:disulfide bond formation protein DsbB
MNPRTAPLVILVLSVAVVGAALLSQYWGGLQPCELCLYQRQPYYVAVLLTAIAAALGRRGTSGGMLTLSALAFAVGAAVAFYHVGVEQHWFAGPTSCTALSLKGLSGEDLRKQLLATPPVRCDEVQWSFAGVSLAGFNLIASLVLAALSWRLAMRMRRP